MRTTCISRRSPSSASVGLALLLIALLFTPLLGLTRRVVRGPRRDGRHSPRTSPCWPTPFSTGSWELPAVTLCTILLGVALVRLGRPRLRRPARLCAVIRPPALLAAAAVLGVVAVVAHVGNGAAAAAQDALDRGDAAAARREADRARRFAPWSAEPWQLLGEADLAQGRLEAGRRDLRRATAEDPGAWYAWFELAVASDGAVRANALARARMLNPLAPELDMAGGATDDP